MNDFIQDSQIQEYLLNIIASQVDVHKREEFFVLFNQYNHAGNNGEYIYINNI